MFIQGGRDANAIIFFSSFIKQKQFAELFHKMIHLRINIYVFGLKEAIVIPANFIY